MTILRSQPVAGPPGQSVHDSFLRHAAGLVCSFSLLGVTSMIVRRYRKFSDEEELGNGWLVTWLQV